MRSLKDAGLAPLPVPAWSESLEVLLDGLAVLGDIVGKPAGQLEQEADFHPARHGHERDGRWGTCTSVSHRYSNRSHAQDAMDRAVADLRNRGSSIISSEIYSGGGGRYWHFRIEYRGGLEQTRISERFSSRHHAQEAMEREESSLRNGGAEILDSNVRPSGRKYWVYEIRYRGSCR